MAKKKEIKVTGKQLVDTYRNDQIKLENLKKRSTDLRSVMGEMLTASESLKEMQKAKGDEKIMVSLGAGIYAEAKIANTKSVKTSLAGNILVEEKAEKAVERLEKEIARAKKDLDSLGMEIQQTMRNMQGISEIIQRTRQNQAEKAGKGIEPSSVS